MADDQLTDEVARIERILSKQFYMTSTQGRNQLWNTYRLTREQVAELMCKQRGFCACCGIDLDIVLKWAIDHQHGTFKIRGILCFGCNSGIGKLGDSVEGLMKAVAYLRSFQ